MVWIDEMWFIRHARWSAVFPSLGVRDRRLRVIRIRRDGRQDQKLMRLS